MFRFARSDIVIAALAAAAAVFGILGFAGFDVRLSDGFLFVAWSLTLLALFMLAIRVPLRGSGSRLSAWVVNALISCAAIAVMVAAVVPRFPHLSEAQVRAYEAVRAIRFAGAWYRRDIAERAIRGER